MKTLNFNVMLIFRLLFKGTKVPENREGILFPDLKVGAIQPVWLAAPAAGWSAAEIPIYRGQAIKPFNQLLAKPIFSPTEFSNTSTKVAGYHSITTWLPFRFPADFTDQHKFPFNQSGRSHPVGAQRKSRFIGNRPVWQATPAVGQAIQPFNYSTIQPFNQLLAKPTFSPTEFSNASTKVAGYHSITTRLPFRFPADFTDQDKFPFNPSGRSHPVGAQRKSRFIGNRPVWQEPS